MATTTQLLLPWMQTLLDYIADHAASDHGNAMAACDQWMTHPEQLPAIERTLVDLVDIPGFLAAAEMQQNPPGISLELAHVFIDAALAVQLAALHIDWQFLLQAKTPHVHLTSADLLDIYHQLDRWDETLANKVNVIRQNPFWLMQLDRDALMQFMPKVAARDLRKQWMRFLNQAWRCAPDKDYLQYTTGKRYATVLAVLLNAYDHGHTYVTIRNDRNPGDAGFTLQGVRELTQLGTHHSTTTPSDAVIREWIHDLCRFSAREDSPILRSYGLYQTTSGDNTLERVQWMWLYRGESTLADQFVDRLKRPAYPWPAVGDAILNAGYVDAAGQHHDLDPLQKDAIRFLYTTPFGILAAPPGTGKTTVIGILHAIARQDPLLNPPDADPDHPPHGFLVAAPTGRAARVVGQSIAQISQPLQRPAATAHSFVATANGMARTQGFLRGILAPWIGDGFLIVDEAFATDAGILGALAYRVGLSGRFLLVGDPDQLLPVAGGAPAYDMFLAAEKAVAARQLAQSPIRHLGIVHRSVTTIANNARALWADPEIDGHTGQPRQDPRTHEPVIAHHQWDASSFPALSYPSHDPQDVVNDLTHTVQQWQMEAAQAHIPPTTFWHVITWRRHDARLLNAAIRAALFPQAPSLQSFVVGDRIVQTHNDYRIGSWGLRNGEFGIVTAVTQRTVTADFGQPEPITVSLRYAHRFWHYAYATTTHKAQGGEWHRVAFVNLPKTWVEDQLKARDLLPHDSAEEDKDPLDHWDGPNIHDVSTSRTSTQTQQLYHMARRVWYVGWTRAKESLYYYSLTPEDDIRAITRTPNRGKRLNKEGRRTRLASFIDYLLKQGGLPNQPGTGAKKHL